MADADPLTELAFEIERFEWTGDDRLEVTGRWFGVRGLRFIRPTLHVRLGDRRRRLIALLDDKPWPADGEGTWVAAFSWRGSHDGVTAARLEVAPDVVIDLPAPGAAAAGATLNPRPRPKPKARRKPPAPRREPASPQPQPAGEPPRADAPAADTPPSAAPELATLALQRRLVEERAERERLAADLEAAKQQIAALSEHHEASVERARELVKVEGELSAATARAERAETERNAAITRAEMAEAAAARRLEAEPIDVPRRTREPRQYGTGTRIAAVALVALLLTAFGLILGLI